jgi:hypothetical protein
MVVVGIGKSIGRLRLHGSEVRRDALRVVLACCQQWLACVHEVLVVRKARCDSRQVDRVEISNQSNLKRA